MAGPARTAVTPTTAGRDSRARPSSDPEVRGERTTGALEVAEDHAGDAYRAVYTVTLPDVVYVLHAFQKKSRRGIATPKREIELIRQRLGQAQELHARRSAQREGGEP